MTHEPGACPSGALNIAGAVCPTAASLCTDRVEPAGNALWNVLRMLNCHWPVGSTDRVNSPEQTTLRVDAVGGTFCSPERFAT